jgi:hypothetical protein
MDRMSKYRKQQCHKQQMQELLQRRTSIYMDIYAAIKSIHSCIAALERLNANRKVINGSNSLPWALEHEFVLEGIAEALAYPERTRWLGHLGRPFKHV